MTELQVRWHKSINEISENSWKILANDEINPFYQKTWIRALETSESICNSQGWQPLHLSLWRGNQASLIAEIILKSFHSLKTKHLILEPILICFAVAFTAASSTSLALC